jgi:hypothetical protein
VSPIQSCLPRSLTHKLTDDGGNKLFGEEVEGEENPFVKNGFADMLERISWVSKSLVSLPSSVLKKLLRRQRD